MVSNNLIPNSAVGLRASLRPKKKNVQISFLIGKYFFLTRTCQNII